MPYRYLINTEKQLDALVDYIKSEPIWAYDTETNGEFSQHKLALIGISFGFDNFACYIPLNHIQGKQLPLTDVVEKLKPIFEDPTQEYVAHNAKFDEKVLNVYGIQPQGIAHDTYIIAWLFADSRADPKGLKPLTLKHLGISMETYEDVIRSSRKKRGEERDFNFGKVPFTKALSYAADDAYYTLQLFKILYPRLQDEGLLNVYKNIERPFTRVLKDIEYKGILIDRDYLTYAGEEFPRKSRELESKIYKEAGCVFNINSDQQLGKILFDKLEIGTNVPKTKRGQYSTNARTLKQYSKYDIVDSVLRYKKILKTYSTFVEGITDFIEPDGRIHASFNQPGTITGRLSSSKPNMQQVTGDEVEDVGVRNLFVPPQGYDLVVADYGQMELRVLAHCAKDKAMITAFKSGRDFHEETARRMFNLTQEATHRQRFLAKGINFGIPYGRGPKSIAEVLECSLSEAKEYIELWFEEFPQVKPYQRHVIASGYTNGYVRTLSGRKRRLLPSIRSTEWKVRGNAERQAFNTRIQGSAADIIKLAMVALAPQLKAVGAHMIIQVHDELVVETPEEKTDTVISTMKHIMEHPLNGKNPLILPLEARIKVVKKWGDAH